MQLRKDQIITLIECFEEFITAKNYAIEYGGETTDLHNKRKWFIEYLTELIGEKEE